MTEDLSILEYNALRAEFWELDRKKNWVGLRLGPLGILIYATVSAILILCILWRFWEVHFIFLFLFSPVSTIPGIFIWLGIHEGPHKVQLDEIEKKESLIKAKMAKMETSIETITLLKKKEDEFIEDYKAKKSLKEQLKRQKNAAQGAYLDKAVVIYACISWFFMYMNGETTTLIKMTGLSGFPYGFLVYLHYGFTLMGTMIFAAIIVEGWNRLGKD